MCRLSVAVICRAEKGVADGIRQTLLLKVGMRNQSQVFHLRTCILEKMEQHPFLRIQMTVHGTL